MNREDIDVTRIGIHDDFMYAGKVFHGLKELQEVSFEDYNKKDKMKGSPYVVIVEHLYPCFDSEDYANENRYYQNFYLTTDKAKAERICEETETLYRFSTKPVLYPILEPMFSMGKIEERHLPYIYYHGEGDELEIVQNRNAPDNVKVTPVNQRRSKANPFSVFNPYKERDMLCMYGPPTDIIKPNEWMRDDIPQDEDEGEI